MSKQRLATTKTLLTFCNYLYQNYNHLMIKYELYSKQQCRVDTGNIDDKVRDALEEADSSVEAETGNYKNHY